MANAFRYQVMPVTTMAQGKQRNANKEQGA
jgi:hypothetical protein